MYTYIYVYIYIYKCIYDYTNVLMLYICHIYSNNSDPESLAVNSVDLWVYYIFAIPNPLLSIQWIWVSILCDRRMYTYAHIISKKKYKYIYIYTYKYIDTYIYTHTHTPHTRIYR